MRIELRNEAESVCPTCGSHELLKIKRGVGYQIEPLSREFNLDTDLPRWAFLRRRMLSRLQLQMDEVEARLIDDARYPFVEEPLEIEA